MRGLELEDSDGVPVARLPADVDAANAESVGEVIAASFSHDSPGVVADLTATRYLDSTGSDMLFRLAERMATRRQRLHLVVPEEAPVRRILEIVSISDIVAIHPDVTSALGAVRGDGAPAPAS